MLLVRAVQRVCLPRYSLYPRRLFASVLPANRLSRIQKQLVRPSINSISISNAGEVLDQSTTEVKLRDDEDVKIFECDEEPLMLSSELGYGYYPLTLGERLHNDKYEVVRKLGWGLNSSAWLAKTHDENHKPRYVAIKVLTVNATARILDNFLDESRFKILKKVTTTDSGHAGYKHCITLRDYFVARSKHGPHMCLVTDVLGINMAELQNSRAPFLISVVKRIIKQTLLALDYLHRRCHIVHTNVTPSNILVPLEDGNGNEAIHEEIDAYLVKNPSATYEPRVEPNLFPVPIITVESQPLPNLRLDPNLTNIEIRLVDYGHAVSADATHNCEAQPVLLRAPEVILGHAWSTPADIWSVGCLLFDYLVGSPLFQLRGSSPADLTDSHLTQIMEHIGPFPSNFLNACSRRTDFFDDQGSLLRVKQLVPLSIDEWLLAYRLMDENDIAPAAAFIRRCLTIDPAARPSALTLLDDEWLRY